MNLHSTGADHDVAEQKRKWAAVDACKRCDDEGVRSGANGLAVCTHPSPRGVPLPRDESTVVEAS